MSTPNIELDSEGNELDNYSDESDGDNKNDFTGG